MARQRVCEYLDAHRDDIVELTAELVEAPSVSGNEAPAQQVVIDRLRENGLELDVWEPDVEQYRDHPGYFDTKTYDEVGYEGRENVAATIPGSGDGKSLALAGHIDVVDVDADEWTYDPWAATVEDGRLYGRGSCDMKGGLAANILAYEALSACGVELEGDLILESTIDEEAGGTGGALSALERGYRPDAAVIPEPFGLPNVGIASAGVLYFRLTVPGKSAHAAFGFEGVNAVNKATKIVTALDELDRERKERVSFEPSVNQHPNAEGSVTNLNVGIFDAGDWPSTVPPEATLECRIGWPPGETREEVRAEVLDTIDEVVQADEWLSEHPPEIEWFGWSAEAHKVDEHAEIVELATRTAAEVCGSEGQFVGGLAGLDERFYVNYYDIPAPTVGPVGANLHGADEYVEIDSLLETAKTLAIVAMDYCGVAEE